MLIADNDEIERNQDLFISIDTGCQRTKQITNQDDVDDDVTFRFYPSLFSHTIVERLLLEDRFDCGFIYFSKKSNVSANLNGISIKITEN